MNELEDLRMSDDQVTVEPLSAVAAEVQTQHEGGRCPSDDLPDYLSIQQICQRAGVSRSFLAMHISKGTLASTKVGARRFISRDSYINFFNGGQ